MGDSSGEEDDNYIFKWIPCNDQMKRQTDSTSLEISLEPQIQLRHPSQKNIQPKVNFTIEQKKQFKYQDKLEWNWHKTWFIPQITCKLEVFVIDIFKNRIVDWNNILDPQTNEKLLLPKNIYVEIYVTKREFKQEGDSKFRLIDVGIQGQSRREFYNSYSFAKENKREDHKIFLSRISSDIYVDSRKSARETKSKKKQSLVPFIDPFLPDNFGKAFNRLENKKQANFNKPIDNSIEGLLNFLSASNLKKKVKHPLFLAIRFSTCLTIYYNTNTIPFNNNNEEFVEAFQKELLNAQNKSNIDKNMSINDKSFILIIENTLQSEQFKEKQEINGYLQLLHGNVVHVMIGSSSVPEHFSKIEDIEGIKEAYTKVYSKLSKSTIQNSGEENESSALKKKGNVKQEKEDSNSENNDEWESFDEDEEQEQEEIQSKKKIKENDQESSQEKQVLDNNKMNINNPNQQREVVFNPVTSNLLTFTNLILRGIKPQKSNPLTLETNQDESSLQINSKTDIFSPEKISKEISKQVTNSDTTVSTQNKPTTQYQFPFSSQLPQQPLNLGQLPFVGSQENNNYTQTNTQNYDSSNTLTLPSNRIQSQGDAQSQHIIQQIQTPPLSPPPSSFIIEYESDLSQLAPLGGNLPSTFNLLQSNEGNRGIFQDYRRYFMRQHPELISLNQQILGQTSHLGPEVHESFSLNNSSAHQLSSSQQSTFPITQYNTQNQQQGQSFYSNNNSIQQLFKNILPQPRFPLPGVTSSNTSLGSSNVFFQQQQPTQTDYQTQSNADNSQKSIQQANQPMQSTVQTEQQQGNQYFNDSSIQHQMIASTAHTSINKQEEDGFNNQGNQLSQYQPGQYGGQLPQNQGLSSALNAQFGNDDYQSQQQEQQDIVTDAYGYNQHQFDGFQQRGILVGEQMQHFREGMNPQLHQQHSNSSQQQSPTPQPTDSINSSLTHQYARQNNPQHGYFQTNNEKKEEQ